MGEKFPENAGLYFITDRKLSKNGLASDAKSALSAGVKIIQYREKEYSTSRMLEEASFLKKICSEHNAIFIVNDRLDIALAVNADGVHLGQEDMPFETAKSLMPSAIIGVTVHNLQEAKDAERKGASYLGVSPIFATSTKPDAGKAAGVQLLKEIKSRVKIPVVAIGGINESNLQSVLETGCRNVSMISAILNAENVEAECREINRKISAR